MYTNTIKIYSITFTPEHMPKQDPQAPLYASVMGNHVEIVRLLLDAGVKQFDTREVRETMLAWNGCKVCVEGQVQFDRK